MPWALVDAVDADLLSFDLARTPLEPHARRALRRLLRRGGRVAWGALDPVDPGTSGDVAGLVAAALHAVAGAGLDVDAVAARQPAHPRVRDRPADCRRRSGCWPLGSPAPRTGCAPRSRGPRRARFYASCVDNAANGTRVPRNSGAGGGTRSLQSRQEVP